MTFGDIDIDGGGHKAVVEMPAISLYRLDASLYAAEREVYLREMRALRLHATDKQHSSFA